MSKLREKPRPWTREQFNHICNSGVDAACFTRSANEQEIAAAVRGELFDMVEYATGRYEATAEGPHVPHHRQDPTRIFFGKKDWSKKIL